MLFKASILTFCASQLASLAFGAPLEDSSAIRARAPASFKHPGVVLDIEQLDFIKSKVNSGAQPWTNAYNAMLSSNLGSTTRAANPTATVECGPTSTPNNGCTEERTDALAAYTMSLAWYITGVPKYAQKAISYMNAWANTIKAHTNSNAPLQTGWAGASWARAAEIIRHTNAGWSSADINKFENMLRDVYLSKLIVGSSSNGNWELGELFSCFYPHPFYPHLLMIDNFSLLTPSLVMMEAAIGISVFLNDPSSYDTAMSKFSTRLQGYVYLTQDGSLPKQAPGSGSSAASIKHYWNDQQTFPESGIAQETCRDFVHTGYGLASSSHVLETARIQGNDLYGGDLGTRLRYGLGFHTKYENGAAKPSWLCDHPLVLGLGPGE